MVVNTNVLAVNSHRNMKNTTALQARSSARLSSGLKINSAADDAAGLAISEKMRAQIRGLDMASKNTQDATSLIQTAEGGMQEVDNMIQRMRELTVQAANGTNEFNTENGGDRQKIQDELNMLAEEIDSMSDRVEFNNKKVISGDYADDYKARKDSLQNTIDKSTATLAAINPADTATLKTAYDAADVVVNGNGTAANIGTDAAEASFAPMVSAYKAKVALAKTDVAAIGAAMSSIVPGSGDKLAALDPGSATFETDLVDALKTFAKDPAIIDVPGLTTAGAKFVDDLSKATTLAQVATAAATVKTSGTAATANGPLDKMAVALDKLVNTTNGTYGKDVATFAATYVLAGSNLPKNTASGAPTVNTNAAFLNELDKAKVANATAKETLANTKKAFDDRTTATNDATKAIADSTQALVALEAEHTANPENFRPGLFFQVGANADQKLEISIKSVSTQALGLRDAHGKFNIDVVTEDSSAISNLIDRIDDALTYVTSERSKLGAAQNRLEYTQKSLDISSENLTASESRIRDTDMAKEMMNLTKANVLSQAAQSMLAQANQAPQGVLQLLR